MRGWDERTLNFKCTSTSQSMRMARILSLMSACGTGEQDSGYKSLILTLYLSISVVFAQFFAQRSKQVSRHEARDMALWHSTEGRRGKAHHYAVLNRRAA